MPIDITNESLSVLKNISHNMEIGTFHHHYHILYDLRRTFLHETTYVEIGAYAGGSASLISSYPHKTNVISIDIGNPISEDVVIRNIDRFKYEKSHYTYIKGDSTNSETVSKLESILNGKLIQILFIDGDHRYDAVINDFILYSKFVDVGGYIVFDDYLDSDHSPEVKPAVNFIIDNMLHDDFEVIGCLPNFYKARPEILEKNNCFIIKKNITSIVFQ